MMHLRIDTNAVDFTSNVPISTYDEETIELVFNGFVFAGPSPPFLRLQLSTLLLGEHGCGKAGDNGVEPSLLRIS